MADRVSSQAIVERYAPQPGDMALVVWPDGAVGAAIGEGAAVVAQLHAFIAT